MSKLGDRESRTRQTGSRRKERAGNRGTADADQRSTRGIRVVVGEPKDSVEVKRKLTLSEHLKNLLRLLLALEARELMKGVARTLWHWLQDHH